ncbi:MAG: transposase family protein, partial [bacterium]|nr:transposase family protein [bacterium]
DNGPQFVSSAFQAFLQRHGIEHIRSAVYNPTENGLVEVFNRTLKRGVQSFAQDRLSWEEGIGELLKTYRATPLTPDTPSPAERFYQRPFRLDFQPVRSLWLLRSSGGGTSSGADGCKPLFSPGDAQYAARRLKWGPFHVGDLVLTRRPQTLKGHSPYAGPFRVVKVVGRYSYILSDGQKWNTRLLKRYQPPVATWTELLGPLTLPDAVVHQDGREDMDDTQKEGHEGHRYPTRDRRPPDRYTPEDFRPQKTREQR